MAKIKFISLFLFVLLTSFACLFYAGQSLESLVSAITSSFMPLVIITAAGSWYILSHIDNLAKEVGENSKLKKSETTILQAKFRALKDEVTSNVIGLIVLFIAELLTSAVINALQNTQSEELKYIILGLKSLRVTCYVMALLIIWNQLSSIKIINKYREIVSS